MSNDRPARTPNRRATILGGLVVLQLVLLITAFSLGVYFERYGLVGNAGGEFDDDEPLHGYEIIRRLEARSQGYFRFKEGLVYPTLHRMEQDGVLESRWLGEPGTRRRKVYVVTDKGRRQFEVEMQRWQIFAQQMNQLLGLETA